MQGRMTQQEKQIYTKTQRKPFLRNVFFPGNVCIFCPSTLKNPINTSLQRLNTPKNSFFFYHFLPVFDQIRPKTRKKTHKNSKKQTKKCPYSTTHPINKIQQSPLSLPYTYGKSKLFRLNNGYFSNLLGLKNFLNWLLL
jgi:hypothetical protein